MRAFKPVLKDGFARLNKEDAESAMPVVGPLYVDAFSGDRKCPEDNEFAAARPPSLSLPRVRSLIHSGR